MEITCFSFVADPDRIKATALFILPYLFQRVGNVNRNNKENTWVPSQQEAAYGFILPISSPGTFSSSLLERVDFYASKKLTFQPVTTVIGSLAEPVSDCRVVINQIEYPFGKNLDAAFDFCFKSFFALNADFPKESQQPYIFFQNFIYGIDKNRCRLTKSLINLIKELE